MGIVDVINPLSPNQREESEFDSTKLGDNPHSGKHIKSPKLTNCITPSRVGPLGPLGQVLCASLTVALMPCHFSLPKWHWLYSQSDLSLESFPGESKAWRLPDTWKVQHPAGSTSCRKQSGNSRKSSDCVFILNTESREISVGHMCDNSFIKAFI